MKCLARVCSRSTYNPVMDGRSFVCPATYGGSRGCATTIRHLIPFATVKLAPDTLGAISTPLLKEEGHLGRETLIPNRLHPICLNGPRRWPAFASDDHPINIGEVDVVQG